MASKNTFSRIQNIGFISRSLALFTLKRVKNMDTNFNLNLFVGKEEDEEEFDMITHDESLCGASLFEQDKLLCLDAFSGTTPSNYNTNERRKRNMWNQRTYRERKKLFALGERRDKAGDTVLIWLIPKNSNHIKGYASNAIKPACHPDLRKIKKMSFDYMAQRDLEKKGHLQSGSMFTIPYETNASKKNFQMPKSSAARYM